jgi:hypothetical protein
MKKAIAIVTFGLAALTFFAAGAGRAADFKMVSQSSSFNPASGLVNFTVQFNQPPDFFTVDEYDRQANSFQLFFIGDPDLHYPDNYDAIVRGEEIHLTGNLLRIRGVSPEDPTPGSGGWGTIRGSSPFSVSGNNLTFSAPLNVLSNHGIDSHLAFHWESYEYGGMTAYGNGQAGLQSGWTLWQGGDGSSPTDWGVAANWFPSSVPSGAGTKIYFGYESPENSVVDMISAGRTVGSIYFSADASTTIQSAGGYALTLNNSGSTSIIDVSGSHAISAPVVLRNNATMSGTGTLDLSNGISGNYTLKVTSGTLNASSIAVNTLSIGAPAATVPEPSALALLFTTAIGAWLYRRRKC